MILFRTVRWKNFLSTGNKFTEIKLNESQKTLIIGNNGSGKSTVLDAISFGLFGKPHRKINKPLLTNSINNKDCVVEIEFDIGKRSYLVRRGLKPNLFQIFTDGELLNQNSHNKEYQKILEQNILKLNYKSFHQIVVLGSSSFIPFMQLSPANRREVIESLLDIDIFSKMNNLIKEKHLKLRSDLTEMKHIADINDSQIKGKQAHIKDVKSINDEYRKKQQERMDYINEQIHELTKVNEELQKSIDVTKNEVNPKVDELNGKLTQLREFSAQFKTELNKTNKDINLYENNEECPSCHQYIDLDFKTEILDSCYGQKSKFEIALAQSGTFIDEHTNTLISLNKQLDAIADTVTEITLNQGTIRKYQEEKLNVELDKSEKNEDLDELESELETLIDNRVLILNKKADMAEQYEYNATVIELLKDSGIKTKIIKQYLPIINKLINQYLQVLDFYVHFELDESFTEIIKSRHRDEFVYDSFSEGEKSRIDLSLLFAWREIAKMKNSIATNLLILDEVLDSSLDGEGIDNLNKILYTLDEDNNVFIISHRDISDSFFDAKIEFKKPKNFSTTEHTIL
jgi:DNA repair exonuclease SbcCD ATPase subunit